MIRIFLMFSNIKCTYYRKSAITFVVRTSFVAKYRTVKKNSYHRRSLVPFLFTPPLPSNPIYHQLSQREYLVMIIIWFQVRTSVRAYSYECK